MDPDPAITTQLICINTIGDEIVDIFVGHERVRYRLHKKKLCRKIPYFDKILNGGFKEEKDGTAGISVDDTDTFDLMCGWVYSGKLVDLEFVLGKDGVEIQIGIQSSSILWLRNYVYHNSWRQSWICCGHITWR